MRDFSQHFPWKCSPQMAAQIRSMSCPAGRSSSIRGFVGWSRSRSAGRSTRCAYRHRSVYYLRRRLSAVTELFRNGAWTTVPERKQDMIILCAEVWPHIGPLRRYLFIYLFYWSTSQGVLGTAYSCSGLELLEAWLSLERVPSAPLYIT